MSKPPLDLKNPLLAGLFAFLIPGAGHFYQGRYFKGAIYFVCILSTFYYGSYLGDWQVVQFHWENQGGAKRRSIGYLSQVCAGLPALPALWQRSRFKNSDNREQRELSSPIDNAEFQGFIELREPEIQHAIVTGTIHLEPAERRRVRGEFRGTAITPDGTEKKIELQLGGEIWLQQPINASKNRALDTQIVDADGEPIGSITGGVPRPFFDWYQVPHDKITENEIHRRLGKRFELASVFTWIAGLLNLLAIWDAFAGPAYGAGEEYLETLRNKRKKSNRESAEDAAEEKETTATTETAN